MVLDIVETMNGLKRACMFVHKYYKIYFLCGNEIAIIVTLIFFYKQGKNLFQPRLCLILNNRPYCYKTIDLLYFDSMSISIYSAE